MEETTSAIKQSCEDQKKGITTFIEVILNQELGEPFRRDAMKKLAQKTISHTLNKYLSFVKINQFLLKYLLMIKNL